MYYRKERGDMIQVYKILYKKDRVDADKILPLNKTGRTRGHSLKLAKRPGKLNVRKYSFGIRVTNNWNSLPEWVISAKTINDFKDKLDKFWAYRRYNLRSHACASSSSVSAEGPSAERVQQAS